MHRLIRILRSPVVIVLVALAFRLGLLIYYQDHYLLGFEQFKGEVGMIARSIVSGHGYGSPLPDLDTGPTAWTTPVFPLLLAGDFKLFGIYTDSSAWGIWILNSLFSALTCLTVFHIGQKTFGPMVAVCAGWTWAFSYTAVHLTRMVWDQTLYAFLFSLLFLVTLHLEQSVRLRAWVGYGLLWGLVALTNPSCLSVLPFLLAWLWYRFRRRGENCRILLGATCLTLVLSVTPWLVRNYLAFGEHVFLRSTFGLELWLGNNPGVSGGFSPGPHPFLDRDEAEKYRNMGELAYMKEKRRQAFQFIAENPGTVTEQVAIRFVRWWTIPWPIRPVSWFDVAKFLFSLLLSLLALLGLGFAIRAGKAEALAWASVLLVFPIPYYLIHVSIQYRHPVEPQMVVLAGFALVSMFARLRQKLAMAEMA